MQPAWDQLFVVAVAASLIGCGGDAKTLIVQGDSGSPPLDASHCISDSECSDGLFCNGSEICRPGEAAADAFGCMAARRVPTCDDSIACTTDLCSDALNRCEYRAPDADGDGHADHACEDADGEPLGDDCDDDDANRFPGNLEVCDFGAHDEDCDINTFGNRDRDGDGEYDAACCNRVGSETVCGSDCNDLSIAQRSNQPEFCDEVDNDCDGEVDEEMNMVPWYPDNDSDLFGGVDSEAEMSCVPIPGASLLATDCDEDDVSRHPAQLELCDFEDNDCDGVIDEAPYCNQGGGIVIPPDAGTSGTGGTGGTGGGGTGGDAGTSGSGGTGGTGGTSGTGGTGGTGDLYLMNVVQVAAGYEHSCARVTNGDVYCWGENGNGQLGTDDLVDSSIPRRALLENATDIAVGFAFSCAVISGGSVRCWGLNTSGRLGLSDATERWVPTALTGLTNVIDVSLGYNYGCALHSDHTLSCWGTDTSYNYSGATMNLPTLVPSFDVADQIAAGDAMTCSVRTPDGNSQVRAQCWGNGNRGGLTGGVNADAPGPGSYVDVPPDILQMAPGWRHICALQSSQSGAVFCWGGGAEFLGDGIYVSGSNRGRVQVVRCDDAGMNCVALTSIDSIAMGDAASYAVGDDGQLWRWGALYGAANPRSDPNRMLYAKPVLGEDSVASVSASYRHACFVRDDGTAACFGENGAGQLGDGTLVDNPIPVTVLAP